MIWKIKRLINERRFQWNLSFIYVTPKMLNFKITIMNIDKSTPIAMLTVGQLQEALSIEKREPVIINTVNSEQKYVYGIAGIARLFNCSVPTANRIKKSGRIDKAIKQIGRKIVVDAELALQLAGERQGGRR